MNFITSIRARGSNQQQQLVMIRKDPENQRSARATTTKLRKFALPRSYVFAGVVFVALLYLVGKSDEFNDYKVSPQDGAISLKSEEAAAAAVSTTTTTTTTTTKSTTARDILELDFRAIGKEAGTDKVGGYANIQRCANNVERCIHPKAERDVCRSGLHFYDTIYNKWLAPYATENNPMQLLEIGFYKGAGFETFAKVLSHNTAAELHSMDICCIEEGSRAEGKWPWGNFASKHEGYQDLRNKDRLHCGDASTYDFLRDIWTTKMKRKDAPPLKVVIDDGAHLHDQMAASLFFWFPRIEPGGILVIEDIEPIKGGNKFRTHILPQVMKDLHWCGGPEGQTSLVGDDSLCFPTLQPFLQSIHCEMHICVFERNNEPAIEPDKAGSLTPKDAFTNAKDCLFN